MSHPARVVAGRRLHERQAGDLRPGKRRSRLLVGYQMMCLASACVAAVSAVHAVSGRALRVEIGIAALLLCAAAESAKKTHRPGSVTATEVLLLVAFLHLCAVPIADILIGVPQLQFREDSSPSAAGKSELTSLLFVAAMLLAARRRVVRVTPSQPAAVSPRRGVAVVMVLVGLAGLFAHLPRSVNLLLSGTTFTQTADVGGLAGLSQTLARALLPVGSYLLVIAARRRAHRIVLALVLAPVSVLALASFSLNRAAIILPILSMALAAQRHAVRPRALRLGLLVAVAAISFFAIGQYRTSVTLAAHHQTAEHLPRSQVLKDMLDVYGQSPFLTGVVYQDPAAGGFVPGTPIASALSPIPAVGRPYRAAAGSAVYNAVIFGYGEADQIVPTWLEVQASWGYSGLVIVGLAFGLLLRTVEQMVERTKDRLGVYLATLAGLWLAQAPIVSIEVLSQIAVYFLAVPLVLLWAPRLFASGRSR